MADRFPLIVDSSAQQLQELAVGDNLNLASSGLINADNIQASGLSVGVMTATSFIGDGSQLTNLPAAGSSTELTASGTLADGSKVIVNADGTVSAITQTGSSAWIATLGGTSLDIAQSAVAVGSSGNVYVCGYTNSTGAGGVDGLLAKYDASGAIQWQRTFGGTSNEYLRGITIDSSENVYVVGNTNSSPTAGITDLLIVKYDSSGTLQWQRIFGGTGQEYGYGVGVDSSDNVYIAARTASMGAVSNECLIVKYDSSGTLQWQRTLGGSASEYFQNIAVDSSGNSYLSGRTSTVGQGGNDGLIVKYDSSGTLQWQRTLGGTGADIAMGITLDSSGNAYVAGYTGPGPQGGDDIFVAKYNSSGSLQWQRTLGGTQDEFLYDIASDSSSNLYITGHTRSAGGGIDKIFIVKYDSSGTVQWQRTITSGTADNGTGIAVDNSGNIYVSGYVQGAPSVGQHDFFLAKLPDDGSLTGTHGSFTYASLSLTASTSTLITANSSLTVNTTPSLTAATSSLTDVTSSLTSSTTTIASLSTNLTAENFIGISDGAYSNGQTATVQLIGSVDDAQSSLTPGQKYYVQNDGTLSTTADSPSVLAGTAIASTKLLIKK